MIDRNTPFRYKNRNDAKGVGVHVKGGKEGMATKRAFEHGAFQPLCSPPWVVRQKRMRARRQRSMWDKVRAFASVHNLCWYWFERACSEKYRKPPFASDSDVHLKLVVLEVEKMDIDV